MNSVPLADIQSIKCHLTKKQIMIMIVIIKKNLGIAHVLRTRNKLKLVVFCSVAVLLMKGFYKKEKI